MIEITIISDDPPRTFTGIDTPCVLGRHAGDHPDLVLSDPFVSRRQLELAQTDSGQLILRCLGASPIHLPDGGIIESQQQQVVELPIEIQVGRSKLAISAPDLNMTFLPAPATPSLVLDPVGGRDSAGPTETHRFSADEPVTSERLIEWFENLVSLQESVTGLQGLYSQAARAVVELIGLDRCIVLNCQASPWQIQAEHGHQVAGDVPFSRSVVELVLNHQQTVFDSSINLSTADSLSGVSAFVGAPITNAGGTVIACLFGVRRLSEHCDSTGVLPIEAQLVQVISGIVSTRISRLEAEAEQVRTQVQLEQFASPALVREMQSNPQWLDANERELTFLFGDIRGFSGLSERLTAHQIFSLVRDTMDCMTTIIHQHGGFIFNFAGDGIAALWNAPEMSPDHATAACLAAIQIQQELPVATNSWDEQIGEPVRVGLGIHTGRALIGNSGSKHRLKYSPLGHAVNLASRVEGATKYLGVSTLITQATLDHWETTTRSPLAVRDLGEILVSGIDEAVRVHQLECETGVDGVHWAATEQALQLYQQGDMDAARRATLQLIESHPHDYPLQILLQRINDPRGVPQAWQLTNK